MAHRTLEGLHVAIIMDGNGRWATKRHLPRLAGHRAGAETLRRIVEASPDFHISTLTVYAFSSDNWKRPPAEVSALMRLFQAYLQKERARCKQQGVRISVIGRRERLPALLLPEIEKTESATAGGSRLHLRLAVDYSSRDSILAMAEQLGPDLCRRTLSTALGPDVDLMIRTGGEQRLSDFLLWECAYAEFAFVSKMWPDFQASDLGVAIADFQLRDRRFGAIVA
jgi:undecaprenyl diphosphate synthase